MSNTVTVNRFNVPGTKLIILTTSNSTNYVLQLHHRHYLVERDSISFLLICFLDIPVKYAVNKCVFTRNVSRINVI